MWGWGWGQRPTDKDLTMEARGWSNEGKGSGARDAGKGQEGGTRASSEMEELLLRKSGRTQPTHTWTGRKVHADFQLWGCKSYRRVTPTPEPVCGSCFVSLQP